jgi:hypothetical protein
VRTSFLPPGHFLAMQKGAHTAASGLPQIQQVVDPNNKPAPEDDDLPAGVAFPVGDNAPSSTFGQQWSTGPGGPQPRTGGIRAEAVSWGRRHYEDLASTISQMPEHVRGPVARSFARDLPQATSGMGGVDRALFERAATDPDSYSWRSRGRQTSYSRGHYQEVADMLRNVRHRGGVSDEDFQNHVYPAVAGAMHAGAGFTPSGNRNFDSDRFHKWVHGDDDTHDRPPARAPRPRREPAYAPPSPPRPAGNYARGIDPHTESGLSDEGTHYDPNHEGFTNPSRGGRPPESESVYDPVFGWMTKGMLQRVALFLRSEAASMEQGHAEALAQADASNGRNPQHQSAFGGSKVMHGRYLRAWNNLAGLMHGLTGRAPLSKQEYATATGRADLHSHYLAAYAQGRAPQRADDGGQVTATVHTADTWSQPHQTTDDVNPPYNSAETSPDPWSQNASPEASDFSAGQSAGRSDAAAGERPLFADNSSGVSPYVKGYAEGYGSARRPQAQPDVPLSMGGDSGQPVNAQQAQQSFQVARASKHVAGIRRVSAAFAPDALMADPEFRKGYLFASKWRPGQRLVATGSARFEAGLYSAVTDRPEIQEAWSHAHAVQGGRHRELVRRMGLHESFTARMLGSYGHAPMRYLTAGVSTDLITDGPGTSADPMGSTPLNGPGTPPPMGGLSMPAAPGGAPPYQGAPPLPGGPVVPDDAMGRAQEPAQPDGPFTNTFSGDHPENAVLAPVAPNTADSGGYSNRDAYPAGQGRTALLEAFRGRVAANLERVTAHWDDDDEDWEDPRTGDASGSVPEYVDPPRSAPELYEHMMMHHGVTHSPDSTKQPGTGFLQGLHNEMHYGQYRDHPDVVARSVPHHHEPGGY